MIDQKDASGATISVIIPTFNRAWCITEAVESVLNQTWPGAMELIVVDDGSSDFTEKLLEPYTNPAPAPLRNRVELTYPNSPSPFMERGLGGEVNGQIISSSFLKTDEKVPLNHPPNHQTRRLTLLKQENKGVSAARNLGIKNSCGDFVAFLDSDDLWMPEKLSCQMAFFESHPDAMICQTEEIWIRKGKRVNPKFKHKKLSGMIFEPSLHLCLVSPSAVMMRREFFDIKGLFDETLPACEDYDLWLRTAVDMPIHLVDTPCIIKQGGHGDQLSAGHSLDKYRIISIANLLKRDVLSSAQREAALKVLHEKCRIYSQGCLKHNRKEEAAWCQSLLEEILSGV